MKCLPRFASIGAIGLLLAGCESSGSIVAPAAVTQAAPAVTQAMPSSANAHRLSKPLGHDSILAAGGVTLGLCAASTDSSRASCLSSVRMFDGSDSGPASLITGGLTPSDLASIYGYGDPASQGSSKAVIGIVVAYDNPTAEADLAAYRTFYHLPACTTANGCFKKVGAAAQMMTITTAGLPTSVSAHPTTNTTGGWGAEADADIETVSAVCANCKIVLAEAASDRLSDLAMAVHAAVVAGSTIINTSFGAPENNNQLALESSFEPAPVKVVAAAGDSGRQALFPAAATNVIAVAGTTLTATGWWISESVWSGSGGGCSNVFARPSWQPGWCSKRSVADIAVVADPANGISFYDKALGGWGIVGGTSISAPIVTGMFALSGDTVAGKGAQQLYQHNNWSFLPVFGTDKVSGNGAPLSLSAF